MQARPQNLSPRCLGPRIAQLWCALALTTLALPGHSLAEEQSEASPPMSEAAASPSEAGGNVEAPNFRDVPGGGLVPSIFRTTGASLPSLRTPSVYGEPLYLGGAQGRDSVTLPHFNMNMPLRRGFEPEQAQLKLGPIFIRFASASATFLASDNINLTQTNRESGVIGIAQLNMIILGQLTENLQLTIAGSLVYLPLSNQAGFSGFGTQPLQLNIGMVPAIQSQISYETRLLGWPVIFADDFHAGSGSYSNSTRDDSVMFDGANFDKQSRAGRYAFGHVGQTSSSRGFTNSNANSQGEFIYFSNIVSAATTRALPSDVRLNAQASHENIWYNSANRGLPGLRDEASIRLQWDRVNLRFKPFVQYSASRTNQTPGIDQTAQAGIFGPITNQLSLLASIGEFFPSGGRSSSTIWTVALNHEAGPYTTESLSYSRTVSAFDQEYDQNVSYYLRQVLGPTMYAQLFASYGKNTGIFIASESTILRSGIRLTYAPSPRTQFRTSVTYANITGNGQNTITLTGRGEISRYITDSLNLMLFYQYQNKTSNQLSNNYFENLFMLTLTKSFR